MRLHPSPLPPWRRPPRPPSPPLHRLRCRASTSSVQQRCRDAIAPARRRCPSVTSSSRPWCPAAIALHRRPSPSVTSFGRLRRPSSGPPYPSRLRQHLWPPPPTSPRPPHLVGPCCPWLSLHEMRNAPHLCMRRVSLQAPRRVPSIAT